MNTNGQTMKEEFALQGERQTISIFEHDLRLKSQILNPTNYHEQSL